MNRITVLTSTYNRAGRLPQLYDSLVNQTSKEFIWLIINDGSTDDTGDIIKNYISEGKIKIEYYRKNNGGKHTAINYALGIIKTEFVFFVDSDDYLTSDCIEVANKWVEEIMDKKQYMAVSGLRCDPNGRIIGKYPNGSKYREFIDVNQKTRTRYGIIGDKSEIYRVEYLKKYRFPEYDGEKFLPEGALILQVAHEGYLTRYYNKVNYVCEYLEGGLTRTSNQNIKNFKGFTFVQKLIYKQSPFPNNFLALVRFIDIAKNKGMNFIDISKTMDCSFYECAIAEIAGKFRYIIKKIKSRKICEKIEKNHERIFNKSKSN